MRYPFSFVFCLTLGIASGSHAEIGFEVQPMVHDIGTSSRNSATTLRIRNGSDEVLPVEISMFELIFEEEGLEKLERADDEFVVVPPTAIIAPGASQFVRLQWLPLKIVTQSRTFIANVTQVPVECFRQRSSAPIALELNAVVHLSPSGARPNVSVVSANVSAGEDGQNILSLELSNDGDGYTYLSRNSITIEGRDRKLELDPGYVLTHELERLLPAMSTTRVNIPLSGESAWFGPVSVRVTPVEE